MIRSRATLAAVAAVSLWGCFDQVAGNSTETENNVTARSIRVDSVLPAWNRPWWTSTVATLRLDRGNFDFSTTDSSGRDLAVQLSRDLPIPFDVVYWDKAAGRGRIHVRIDPLLEMPGTRFDLLWNQSLRRREDSVAVWTGITDSQRLAINSVLVSDFEQGALRNRLPDAGAWTSRASISAKISRFGVVPDPAGGAGKVLHASYDAGVGSPDWVLVTTSLASSPRCLRSLDSLVLRVRLAGTLDQFSVALEHVGPSGSFKAWRTLKLDTGWHRIRLRPQDFDTANSTSQSVGWAGVRDSVTNLTVLDGGKGEFWIDDVRLYGVDAEDFR